MRNAGQPLVSDLENMLVRFRSACAGFDAPKKDRLELPGKAKEKPKTSGCWRGCWNTLKGQSLQICSIC